MSLNTKQKGVPSLYYVVNE